MKSMPIKSVINEKSEQMFESSSAPSRNDKGRTKNSKRIHVHNKPTAAYVPQIKGSTSQDDIKLGIDFLSKVLNHYEPSKNIDRK